MFLDFSTPDKKTRSIALLEGLSYLILVGICMPLKYWAGIPEATKISGLAHGLLFVLLLFNIIALLSSKTWNLKKASIIFLLSLLPIGAFVGEYILRKEDVKN